MAILEVETGSGAKVFYMVTKYTARLIMPTSESVTSSLSLSLVTSHDQLPCMFELSDNFSK